MVKSYDRVKNFSTSVPVNRTVAEIEKMLTKYGAKHILKEYDENGDPVMLVFSILTEHGTMGVRLPIHPEKILAVFKKQVSNGLLPKKYWAGEWVDKQAQRVGWRIIKDWLDAQITLLNIEMVKIEEIFLPYIYNDRLKMTVYEMLENNKFNFDLLEGVKNGKDKRT